MNSLTPLVLAVLAGCSNPSNTGPSNTHQMDAALADLAFVEERLSTVDASVRACIPACAAGGRCEDGRCVGLDGGFRSVFELSDAARAVLFRTCEPIGSNCAPGLTCLTPLRDAGTRGVCTLPCMTDEQCGVPDWFSSCGLPSPAEPRVCVYLCGNGTTCPMGLGTCSPALNACTP